MSDASLNDIYHLVGELSGTVKSINGKVDDLKHDMSDSEDASAIYRHGVRDELVKLVTRATFLESDMSSVKAKVERMEAVTDDVTKLRHQAAGAGTLGRWAIKVGFGVVGIAGWLVGVYTYLTGRPPP